MQQSFDCTAFMHVYVLCFNIHHVIVTYSAELYQWIYTHLV